MPTSSTQVSALTSPNLGISLLNHFGSLTDPRQAGKIEHKLIDILVIAICAIICGADSWVEVAEFGTEREEWLRTRLELPNGIPSHDTFGRIFSRLSAVQFQKCFRSWVSEVVVVTNGQVIAIDGKTLRRSYDRSSNKAAIHLVSAWATQNRIVLGQVKTAAKSNEITAIPELLQLLDLNDCIVTIDAMGCQKAIAKQIIEQGGDYVLGLKGNQGQLHKDVKEFFEEALENQFKGVNPSYHEESERGHGRVETRQIWTVETPAWLADQEKWKNLRVIGMVSATRKTGTKETVERRFYLSSLANEAPKLGAAVRAHWGIENTLHWSLDVVFQEDRCRVRQGNASENFAVLRHLALGLLQRENTVKAGLKTKRLKCALNPDYLLKVLTAK